MARPTADRWHKKPTALLGGIAIFMSSAIPMVILSDFSLLWQAAVKSSVYSVSSISAVILVGSFFMFGLGLFDDLYNIKPHTKLIGQIIAASFVIFCGFRLHWFNSLTIDSMVTLFWIVAITNAFNLIDNMDGLCAGIGLIVALIFVIIYLPGAKDASCVALIFVGVLSAFLIYNFNPATIFMGDSGSLVIGYGISILSLIYSQTKPITLLATYVVPIFILLLPILDTTLVTVIRLLSGRNASIGGKDHTSHRLVLMGFPEKKAVLFLYWIGVMTGVSAVFVSRSDSLTSAAVIVPVLVSIILMGVYLSQLRVYPEKEFSLLRDRVYTPILIELTYKRHMLLVILDCILVAFSYYLSYRLRFDTAEFTLFFQFLLKTLPAVIVCKLIVFSFLGIYRGIWKHISTRDTFFYIRASFVGALLSWLIIEIIYSSKNNFISVMIIDFMITTSLILGTRGSFRFFIDTCNRNTISGDLVLIYGAGRGGELLIREILNNRSLQLKPIGFIDDDVIKRGKKIYEYEIIGTYSDINRIYEQYKFSGILISFDIDNVINQSTIEYLNEFCHDRKIYLKYFKAELYDY